MVYLHCNREFFGVDGWLREWICVILMVASVVLILQECCFLFFFWGGLFMEAIACCLSQSSVGVPVHSAVVSVVYIVGRSSGEYALASTVSSKRRRGVSCFLFDSRFSCRLLDGGVRLSFLCVMTFGSWVVGSVSSIPTIFRFVGFAARVAFGRFACAVIGLSVIFPGSLPFVTFQFSAFGSVVSEFVTKDAVAFFGVLRRVLDLFCLWFCLSWFYFI